MAIQWSNQPILDSVQLPGSDTKYWVADSEAREMLENLIGVTHFLGVTTTAIADGDNTNPINIIEGATTKSVTAVNGDIVIYKENRGTELAPVWVPLEFIWDGSAWQLLGDQSFDHLGDLAYKDSASGSYTPEGSVNLTPATTNVVTSVTHSFGIDADFTDDSTSGYNSASISLDLYGEFSDISYFGSDQALNYINLASENSQGILYDTIVTDISCESMPVVSDIVLGALPTISNTSTITAAMGTGSSSTTLIFSLSDIGFNQGTQPTISYGNVVDAVGTFYASVSFLTLDPNSMNIVTGISGNGHFYYSVSLTGDIETTTGSALSGITATFTGSASTITVS